MSQGICFLSLASKYCHSDGKWNETCCYTTETFNAILLRVTTLNIAGHFDIFQMLDKYIATLRS